MLAIAVFLLGLLAFLQSQGPVSQTVAIVLSVAAIALALLSLTGWAPWRRGAL